MEITEAIADSLAPNAAAIKNARGVVIKRKLVGLFRSPDGTLLFGDCKGSGAENYRPSADFADPSKPVFRCTCPSRQFPCKHSTDDEFKCALVFLRRAFGDFSPAEKRSITENLGEIWGANVDKVSEVLSTELTEKEKEKLDELSGFDFENL